MATKTQPAAPSVAAMLVAARAHSRRLKRGMAGSAALLGVLAAGALPALAQPAETPQQYCERQVGFVRDVCLRELKSAPPPTPAASAVSMAASTAAGASAPPSSPAKTAPAAAGGAKPYVVSDGNKVDAFTFKGFQTWRAAACDRCHGANQEGLVGPSLIEGLKKLSKDEFKTTVLEGRLERGMPSFGSSEQVKAAIDNLYAYLKGRSDGAITQSRVELAK